MQNNTIKYIFENKQPELRRLVVKYGLTPAKNKMDLWKKVNYLIAKFKDEMLFDVAKIHPDRDLIIWALQQQQQETSPVTETAIAAKEISSNACGCSSADGDDYSNVCGCSSANGDEYSNCYGNPNCNCNKSGIDGAEVSKVVEKTKFNMPLIVVGSLLVVAGLIFLGNKTA